MYSFPWVWIKFYRLEALKLENHRMREQVCTMVQGSFTWCHKEHRFVTGRDTDWEIPIVVILLTQRAWIEQWIPMR